MQKRTTANDSAGEILKEKDNQKITERLIALRRDENVPDNDFYQVFALVTLGMLGQTENGGVNGSEALAVSCDDPLGVVEAFLNKEDCSYRRDESEIETGFRGRNCNIRIVVVKPKEGACMLFNVPEVLKVPEEAEARVVKAICRINWGHVIGAFCYDHDVGELSFRISLPLPTGGLPNLDQVAFCFAACCGMVDEYFPEIAAVCWR